CFFLLRSRSVCAFPFLHDAPTPALYTLSLHDALPILDRCMVAAFDAGMDALLCLTKADLAPPEPFLQRYAGLDVPAVTTRQTERSEEHTSELQSRFDLVCRLLLEKKKDTKNRATSATR